MKANSGGRIHTEHPFATPLGERDPARRLRGRLASAVTVLTAGAADSRVGLTISSLSVAEGNPARMVTLVNEATDFWDVAQATRRFVVHVLEADERDLSEEFAALRPRPGGPFADRVVTDGEWGPVLGEVPTRAHCSIERWEHLGDGLLVIAVIDRIEVGDMADPLVYFRGGIPAIDRR